MTDPFGKHWMKKELHLIYRVLSGVPGIHHSPNCVYLQYVTSDGLSHEL